MFLSSVLKVNQFFVFFICGLHFVSVQTASTPSSSYYTVGVVEYEQTTIVTTTTPEKQLKINLQGYIDILKQFVQNRQEGTKIDIIIFPESTLNSYETAIQVPVPNPNDQLCGQTNYVPPIISQLSCWANEFQKYMLFNIIEIENCTLPSHVLDEDNRNNDYYKKCPIDGFYHYNTNIIFNRDGALIARYRKWNLYQDLDLSTTNVPEFTIFDTDFDVRFGTFTCFDLLFYQPAQELVNAGITDFLHPTKWYSELPFLTANQIQHGWAYANNVNLMVSGASYPANGTTGSGVFAGQHGVLESGMVPAPTSTLYTIEVPKFQHQFNVINKQPSTPKQVPERLLGLNVYRDPNLDQFTNLLLENTNQLNLEQKLCYNDFCCNFKIQRKSFDNNMGGGGGSSSGGNNYNYDTYSYRLIVFAGQRSYMASKQISWLKTCAVIACTDNLSITSCGRIFNENTGYKNLNYFENIEIIGEFTKQKELLIMPSTVDQMFRPLYKTQFNFTTTQMDSQIQTSMKLTKPISDVLTFGIYANYYDGFHNAGTLGPSFSYWLLIISTINLFICIKTN